MNMMNMLNAYMNVCLLPLCMIDNYVYVHVLLQCIFFMYIHVHGAVACMVNAMVASSSSVRGSGTLHFSATSFV